MDYEKKYIDADKLKAEIDKRYAEYRAKMKTEDFTYYEGMADALDLFEQFLESLQQEQPTLDIDEEIDKFMFAPFQNFERVSRHCLVDMGDGKEWVPVYDWKITTYKRADAHFLRKFARHFYELGLNARKEDKQ